MIGHELTHGFDDQGRQFDVEGNLKNWWTDEEVKKYTERASLIEGQYGEYVPLEEMHIKASSRLVKTSLTWGV